MATIIALKVNKTDKNDARSIADAMRCEMYKRIAPKSKTSVEINTLMVSRRVLVEQKVELSNTIRGLLKIHGIRLGSCREATFVKKVKEEALDGYAIAKEGIEVLLNCYEHLLKEIGAITQRIEEISQTNEEIKRLMTIPGVGLITAMSYRIEIDDPKRFKNARAVGAYLGMTPRQYSSGETIRQGKISRCGSKEVRFLLTEAATVMLARSKKWSKLKAWGLKVQRKHGFKKGSVAVGRKLAVIMYRMLVDKTDFIYGEPKEEQLKPEKQTGANGLARAI
jgi:transposase